MKARKAGTKKATAAPSLRSALLAFAARCRALEAEGLRMLGEKPRKAAAK